MRERMAAVAAGDGDAPTCPDRRAAVRASTLPIHGPVARTNAAAARDIGMPATMFGTPVERCAATSSAIGMAANLVADCCEIGAIHVENAIGRLRSSPS